MHAYLPFGDAGKGTYCIKTTGSVRGVGGVSGSIADTRSACFKR